MRGWIGAMGAAAGCAALLGAVAITGSVREAPAAAAAATMPASVDAAMTCTPYGSSSSFTAALSIAFDAVPTEMVPLGSYPVTGSVSFTATTTAHVAIPEVVLSAGLRIGPKVANEAPTPFQQEIRVGVSEGVRIRIDVPYLGMTVTNPATGTSAEVSCTPTGDVDEVVVPLVLPEDGSLQWFRLSDAAVCDLADRSRQNRTFTFTGIAPARLVVGEVGTVVANYEDWATITPESTSVAISVPGAGTQPRQFSLRSGLKARIDIPAASTTGETTISFAGVKGNIHRPGSSGPLSFSYTFPEPRSVASIPVVAATTQPVHLRAEAQCASSTSTWTQVFTLDGTAPTSVRPGDAATLDVTLEYPDTSLSLSTWLYADGVVGDEGASGMGVSVQVRRGPAQLTLPPAQPGGPIVIGFFTARGANATPGGSSTFTCTFPPTGPTIAIPVDGGSTTTTTTTTPPPSTTTTASPINLDALIRWLLALLFGR